MIGIKLKFKDECYINVTFKQNNSNLKDFLWIEIKTSSVWIEQSFDLLHQFVQQQCQFYQRGKILKRINDSFLIFFLGVLGGAQKLKWHS